MGTKKSDDDKKKKRKKPPIIPQSALDARLGNLSPEKAPPKSEAEVLSAKVESGGISRDRLMLAAYLGDPTAQEAVGHQEQSLDTIEDWAFKIRKYGGDEAMARIALAAARICLPVLEGGHTMSQEYRGVVENTELMMTNPDTLREAESHNMMHDIVSSEVTENTYAEKNAVKSIVGAHKVVELFNNPDQKQFNKDMVMYDTIAVVKAAADARSPEGGGDRHGDAVYSRIYSEFLQELAEPVIDWALNRHDSVKDNVDHRAFEEEKEKSAHERDDELEGVRHHLEEMEID